MDGTGACHRKKTRAYQKSKRYARCPRATATAAYTLSMRPNNQPPRTPRSHRSPTPYKWYGEKLRHSHTRTSNVSRHRCRNNADTHHRQRSAHVIVEIATPAIAHTPTLPLSQRIKKERKKGTRKTRKQAKKNTETHQRTQLGQGTMHAREEGRPTESRGKGEERLNAV